MALDLLSTSGINSLISQYTISEMNKRIIPLQDRKDRYSNLSSNYSALSSNLSSLKSLLDGFKETGSSSIFAAKSAVSSNTDFISASVSSSVVAGSYSLRVNQLAKSDVLLSSDFSSAATNTLTGTHSFTIKTGDGEGGEFTSTISALFDGSETNKTALEKIRNAINADKAEVLSGAHDASDTFTGTGSFVINLNGTEKTIDYDYSNLSYDEVIDDLVTKIGSNVDGLTAEKVVNGNMVELKLTVENNDQYLTIDQTADTGGLLGAGSLNINAIKEKSSAGMVSASMFAPQSDTSQLSLTAKKTGLDYRILDISDAGGSSALTAFGLNLGNSRPSFDQSADPDTAGFVYSDVNQNTTLLNSIFEFNGLTITRGSNVISDLVDGMTLTLNASMEAEDTTVDLSVSNDVDHIKSKIENFIEEFNSVYSYVKMNSSSSNGVRGVFLGDSNASSLLSSFRTFGYTAIEGIPAGNLNKLSDIGISFDPHTGLKISDANLLEQKLTGEVEQVEDIFNSANGIANLIYDKIDPFLGIDGYLSTAQSRYDSNIKYLNDKMSSTQTRIDKSAEVMRGRYEQLQMQMAEFYATQNYFSQLSGGF
ncbi:MAG: flagellar filament capping protein FliD [Ignavibacteriae bacterium]|nr:flagellar cap protein FliD [Ignavibacteriota bacterium]NOG97113.1 flagellar filament capping protein FliD [Ignavibacteriota bacterium]